MAYVRKPHPKSVEAKLFKTSDKHIKAAKPKLNTKVKGKTAKYGK